MLPDLPLIHWLTLDGLITVVTVLVYVINSHVMRQRRHPTAAVAWMLFILLLPYLALPAFLLFGTRKRSRPPSAALPTLPGLCSADAWAIETIVALGQPAPACYGDLSVHADGRHAGDALLATIDAAQVSIDLSTYILGRDGLGEAVVDRLCKKAQAGVRVRLLLDGVGCLLGGRPNLRCLVDAGGELALFVPPLHSPLKGRTNLRNHRKLLIADADLPSGRLWCGGRNLSSEYFGGAPGKAPWRDLSFDLRGPLLGQASALFERDWRFAKGLPPVTLDLPELPPAAFPPDGAQLIASGPDQADDTLYALLVTAAYRARQRIVLATPYFVPESALLMALCLAARRGVTVDLLLPAHSNHPLSDLARGRPLRALAAAGGRIWLAPGMMHAKLAVIDDALALSGSANLDSRSLFLNYELMVAFHHSEDVRRFAVWFDRERITASPYVATPPGLFRDAAEGMLQLLGFQL
ncbi:PLDc N-terminal domain-containing protein [Pseudomonas sp. MAP12]|uniref:PLDc N-terminal domain-containing protein n=1 Tax=Geopseudomonas aromaticivorans TaxID=2849492 RepID=A0ABS6MS78_9GAMM|nr:phospholipase D-like domain-containing protein [Pseudomonas aromaticivorans]MBV2131662.1 PLDc N-terminal domain-containing protein [Pseudomonas aromaticivorans]